MVPFSVLIQRSPASERPQSLCSHTVANSLSLLKIASLLKSGKSTLLVANHPEWGTYATLRIGRNDKSFVYRFLAPSEVEGYAVCAGNSFIYRFYADFRFKFFIYRIYAFAPGWQGLSTRETEKRVPNPGRRIRKRAPDGSR